MSPLLLWALAVAALWLALGVVLGPGVGWWLRRRRRGDSRGAS
jgi:hypothetical protein